MDSGAEYPRAPTGEECRCERRKPIDIERLLNWAYREELPKLQFLGAGLSGCCYGAPLNQFRLGSAGLEGCLLSADSQLHSRSVSE